MKPTEEQVKLVNNLIREAINHGGDGQFFSNGDDLYAAMDMYRSKVWGTDSGICIFWDENDYPYFASLVEEAVGQHKEME